MAPRLSRAAVALLVLGALARGQEPVRPSAGAVHVDRPPTIDGRLDEEAWKLATPIGELTQIEPQVGVPPTEATEVRFVHDADHLYMAIRCFDREPERIVNTTRSRDALLEVDDRVEIIFDTFLDRRSAFFFQINAGGSKGDALITDNGGNFNKPWDGIWDGVARIDSQGWSAELALPFKTLNFDPNTSTWGFNIMRYIGRKREEARWANPSRDYGLFDVYHAGNLRGLTEIRQGVGLDVAPFFVSHWRNERDSNGDRQVDAGDEGDKTLTGEPGFDLFYKIIPSLTFSLTVNTDFAETEVDTVQINLTRFPLFFPERRDFFLQDAGLFEFGTDSSLIPFFSRRVGLFDGQEVPILAGAKVTGRAGDYNIGLLDVATDEVEIDSSGTPVELDQENLFAGRISRNVGEQSTVGLILTHGSPQGGENTVFGVDAKYQTSRFMEDRNLIASAFVIGSDSEDLGQDGDGFSYGAGVSSPNDLLSWNLGVNEIQEGFEASLGFIPRKDIRSYSGGVVYQPRPDWDDVRQLEISLDSQVITDTGNQLETVEVEAQPLGVEWESGDAARLEVVHVRDEVPEDFDLEDVTVPKGHYEYDFGRLEVDTAENRPLSAGVSFNAGEFFDGDRSGYVAEVTWHPGPLFNGRVAYEYNDVSLPGGDFETEVAVVHGDFSFTPELSWNNLVQWDTDSDTIGVNSRLRWIPVPEQEIFLVLNESLDGTVPLFQELSFKITYVLRF